MAVTGARGAVGRTFSSLHNRNYRFYFAGQGLSLIGTWMQTVAQSWYVYVLTHSGLQVGLIVAVQALPILFFGPVGGIVGDRYGRYRMLFWTQSLAGVQAFVLATLALTGTLNLWALYPVAISLGLIKAIDNPTRQTFIVEMVGRDDLRNAVTLNTISNNIARVVGPAIAGTLIAAVGSGWCFFLNGVSFALVISGLAAIRKDELRPSPRMARMRGQISEGIRYVAHAPRVRNALMMMAVIGCLTYEFQTSLPLMAGDAFHGDSSTYGFLTAFMGAGAVVGGLAVAGRKRGGARALTMSALIFGIVVLLATLAPTLLTEEMALIFVGAASVTFTSLTNSTLQLESEPEMRGRVMSLWSVAFQGTTPIGGPLVGFIGGSLGPRYGLGIGAVAAIGAGLFGLIGLRRGDLLAKPSEGRAELSAESGIPDSDISQERVGAPAKRGDMPI